MDLSIIINSAGLFTALSIDVFLIKMVSSDDSQKIALELFTVSFLGLLTVLFWDFLNVLYAAPLMVLGNITSDTTDIFSDELIGNTIQYFYSILVFNFTLYSYLKYYNILITRRNRLITRFKLAQIPAWEN
ncbi:hypothetical protein [Mucilaginibacter agri]|uniref:hypothetical protein n=1 Tax=Mucilaginibacter agri TaxID=2695265 RepID=UPI001AA136E4|nr:hypothetical protein [Mucilaginibacter agri]